jgi:hypothetical protein
VASRLYDSAVSSLDLPEREALAAVEGRLGAARSPAGTRLVENLHSEAHMVGDEGYGHAAELTSFLRALAAGQPESGDSAAGYERCCGSHELRGLRVPLAHLPPRLLRYTTSRSLAGALIEKVVGKSARADFDDDLFVEDLLVEMAASWDPASLSGVDLHWRAVVFATFDHPGGAPRSDARGLAEALALPFWAGPRAGDELLIELGYPAAAVSETRFPTIADAGLMHLFRPAPEMAPRAGQRATWCGWTEPAGGVHPPQPELVHANAPVAILDQPPRFVGRVPL